MASLDPYEKPPEDLRKVFKMYQKMSDYDIDIDPDILDFSRPAPQLLKHKLQIIRRVQNSSLNFKPSMQEPAPSFLNGSMANVYESQILPGRSPELFFKFIV